MSPKRRVHQSLTDTLIRRRSKLGCEGTVSGRVLTAAIPLLLSFSLTFFGFSMGTMLSEHSHQLYIFFLPALWPLFEQEVGAIMTLLDVTLLWHQAVLIVDPKRLLLSGFFFFFLLKEVCCVDAYEMNFIHNYSEPKSGSACQRALVLCNGLLKLSRGAAVLFLKKRSLYRLTDWKNLVVDWITPSYMVWNYFFWGEMQQNVACRTKYFVMETLNYAKSEKILNQKHKQSLCCSIRPTK